MQSAAIAEITRREDSRMAPRGLRYYLHDEVKAFRFHLCGSLLQNNAEELEQVRQTASSVLHGRPLIVDVTRVESVDGAGRDLMARWYGLGAQFVVSTPKAKARVESITGAPINLREQKVSPQRPRLPAALLVTAGALAMLVFLMGAVR